ncbi:MAG: cation transporter [Rhodospirillaceae bacterium BRH_c57]|nr:MAG: cation transporter [Rhodospirillaceae bacterium BRH_c57]
MIEKVLSFAVQRRVFIVLITAALAAFGLYSMQALPIDAVPDITNNQVQINSEAPALSPMEVEQQVTFPVETALAGIPGLKSTRSLSRNGFSQVTAIFDDEVDIYFARQQVMERITEAKEDLPPGVDPTMGSISTGLGEVYMWTVRYAEPEERVTVAAGEPGWQGDGSYLTPEGQRLTTEQEQTAYLRTVQDWIIAPQLKSVRGVATVDAIGGYVKQYHVQPDPAKLLGFGLTFGDVLAALERNNASVGAGYLERNGEGYVVRAGGRIESVADLGAVVVATRGAVPVHLKDIARIGFGPEQRTGSASVGGQEAVVGTAVMLLGSNSRTVAAAVDAKMQDIRKSLPGGVEAQTVLDRTGLVNAAIKTVAKNLTEGAILVIAVLLLLLGNFRAAVIAMLVIPITMLITMTGMLEGRISANLMSLGALDFGLIVDGAVIIAENCLRKLAERQHALGRELTLQERLAEVTVASKEMIQPSVYGQGIIILVYVPLLTLSGVEGKMFEPMALTVIIALATAFVLSLTFVPAMIALLIRGRIEERENRIIRGLKSGYAPLLTRVIARPVPVIAGATALFVVALFVFLRLGQEFIPSLDEGDIAMHAMRIPSTSLTQSQAMQTKVEQTVSQFDEVAFVYSKTGTAEAAADPMPPNVSDTFIIFKPRSEWPDPDLPKEELVKEIETAVSKHPGNAFEFTQPIQMRFNELLAGVRGDVAIKVYGDDFGVMQKTAGEIAGVLRQIPGAADVKVEQATGLPFLDIQIDRAAAARRGLSISDVQDVISVAIGGRQAGLLFEGDRRFDIVVRLPDEVRSNMAALENLPVPLPEGDNGKTVTIPLKEVATFNFTEGPNQISRENGKRRMVVQANVRGRDIGSLVAEAQERIAAEVTLPPGYWLDWGGQFENLIAARDRLSVVVPACFALILLLLYSALGSVRSALIVFSGVPLALTGGVFSLWLRDMPFSITAGVGFIALSGIAVLNGLVLITYIKQLVDEGMNGWKAIYVGSLTRLRPVVMTALVASLGFVPMMLATGTGAEVQKPLATVVVGGLVTSTVLTLFVLPALYRLFSGVMLEDHKEQHEPLAAE